MASPYNPDYRIIDKSLLPVSEFMTALSDIEGELMNDFCSMSIETIKIEMPFELDITFDSGDDIVLGSSPPTQKIETSFMPVFHKIKFTMEILHNEEAV